MSKKEELNKEIEEIWRILVICKESFLYSQYLHQPDTDKERDYIEHSKDFLFIRHTLWRMTIVELTKLLRSSNSHRFNIFHFIKKMKIGEYYAPVPVSEQTISKWEALLEENKALIQDVVNLRDKLYAHTDPTNETYINPELTFENTETLIKIIETVVQDIHFHVFDTEAIMQPLYFDKSRFNIIKILADEKERRITQIGNKNKC